MRPSTLLIRHAGRSDQPSAFGPYANRSKSRVGRSATKSEIEFKEVAPHGSRLPALIGTAAPLSKRRTKEGDSIVAQNTQLVNVGLGSCMPRIGTSRADRPRRATESTEPRGGRSSQCESTQIAGR